MSEEIVREIAAAVGGTVTDSGRLPDGSGFATMSMPLPSDRGPERRSVAKGPPMIWPKPTRRRWLEFRLLFLRDWVRKQRHGEWWIPKGDVRSESDPWRDVRA